MSVFLIAFITSRSRNDIAKQSVFSRPGRYYPILVDKPRTKFETLQEGLTGTAKFVRGQERSAEVLVDEHARRISYNTDQFSNVYNRMRKLDDVQGTCRGGERICWAWRGWMR